MSNFKKLVLGVWIVAAMLFALVLYRQFAGENTNPIPVPIAQQTSELKPNTPNNLITPPLTCEINLKKLKEIEPFLQDQIKSLLTKEGTVEEKQKLLACISKFTTAPNDNKLFANGHLYELNNYITRPQAVVLDSINIQWYRKNDSISSCKIKGMETSKPLIIQNNNKVAAPSPILVDTSNQTNTSNQTKPIATPSVANEVVTANTFPRKFEGNIEKEGENNEIITISKSSIIQNENIIEFSFSIFGASSSGKNLKGTINLTDNSVELSKIGKGTISKQNNIVILSLQNNTIILKSK